MSQQLTAEPTPMVGNDPAFRMDAYYYGFDATKVLAVDLILSAVACAGKSFHSTCDWLVPCEPYHDQLRGENPVECIQNAAKDAAHLIEAQSEQIKRLEDDKRRLIEHAAEVMHSIRSDDSDYANCAFRSLPDHLGEAIEKRADEIDTREAGETSWPGTKN